jgi:hypothetical protein
MGDSPTKTVADDLLEEVSKTGFTLNYPKGFGSNAKTPTTTPEERRKAFEDALSNLDFFLAFHGGPFALGSSWTSTDICITPTMERLRYQLPISQNFVVYDPDRWPAVAAWFDAMGSLKGYYGRTSGDEISWLSTIPVFARMFGGKDGISKEQEEVRQSEERSDDRILLKHNTWEERSDDNMPPISLQKRTFSSSLRSPPSLHSSRILLQHNN